MEKVSELTLVIVLAIVLAVPCVCIAYKYLKRIRPLRMNRVSMFIIDGIVVLIFVLLGFKKFNKEVTPYNFEDLKMQYKNYVVVDKYTTEPNTYVFKLKNPCNSNVKKVYVKHYLYNSVYYVGDTIK